MNNVSRHGCARRTTRASRARKAESERDDDELTLRGRRNDDDEKTSRMTARTGGRRGARRHDATRDVKTTKTTTGKRRQDSDRNKTSGPRQEQDVKTSAGTRRQDVGRNKTSGRRQEQDVETAKVWKRLLPYEVVVRVSSRSPGRGLFSTKRCAGLSYLVVWTGRRIVA